MSLAMGALVMTAGCHDPALRGTLTQQPGRAAPANRDFDSIAVPAPSCVDGWQITLVPHQGSDPRWAVAPDGAMHIMYIGFGEGQTALRHVAERDPMVADTLGAMGLGSLAIAPDGTASAFLAARSDDYQSPESAGIVRMTRERNSDSWQLAPAQVSNDGGMFNASAIDGEGHAHVAFGNGALYYASDSSGHWVESKVSGNDASQVSVWSLQPDRAGNVHIWFNGVDPTTKALANFWASNSGGRWQTARLPPDVVAPALDSKGRPHLISNDLNSGGLVHSWFDGQAWIVEPLRALGRVSGYDFAIDDNDKLHLLVEIASSNIAYANNRDGVWKVESVISFDGTVPPSARLGLDAGGKPHIAFKGDQSGANFGFAHRCN